MKVYEFGTGHKKIFVMFQCAAEPWWVFKDSAEAMSRDYRVFLVIADGHDEMGTTFVSIEKNVPGLSPACGTLRKGQSESAVVISILSTRRCCSVIIPWYSRMWFCSMTQ